MGFLFSPPRLPQPEPLVLPSPEDASEPLAIEASEIARRRALIQRRRRGQDALIIDPALGELPELRL